MDLSGVYKGVKTINHEIKRQEKNSTHASKGVGRDIYALCPKMKGIPISVTR